MAEAQNVIVPMDTMSVRKKKTFWILVSPFLGSDANALSCFTLAGPFKSLSSSFEKLDMSGAMLVRCSVMGDDGGRANAATRPPLQRKSSRNATTEAFILKHWLLDV